MDSKKQKKWRSPVADLIEVMLEPMAAIDPEALGSDLCDVGLFRLCCTLEASVVTMSTT